MSKTSTGVMVVVTVLAFSCAAFAQSAPATDGVRLDGRFFRFEVTPAWTGGSSPFVEPSFSTPSESRSPRESRVWRTLGGISGGVVGFFGYAPHALSDSRIDVSDAQRITEWSLVTAGAACLGYYLGRSFDR